MRQKAFESMELALADLQSAIAQLEGCFAVVRRVSKIEDEGIAQFKSSVRKLDKVAESLDDFYQTYKESDKRPCEPDQQESDGNPTA